jgi:hypothetical protein
LPQSYAGGRYPGVHTALPDPENNDAGWFAFEECMAKPGIKEAWFEVYTVTLTLHKEQPYKVYHSWLYCAYYERYHHR